MISVISVDDHEMISLGLKSMFSETSDIRLSHFCKTREELVPFIESKTSEELKDMIAMVDISLKAKAALMLLTILLSTELNASCIRHFPTWALL